MAIDQTDFASRTDDAALTAITHIGELLYNKWGTQLAKERTVQHDVRRSGRIDRRTPRPRD